jgi:hypothetical protein
VSKFSLPMSLCWQLARCLKAALHLCWLAVPVLSCLSLTCWHSLVCIEPPLWGLAFLRVYLRDECIDLPIVWSGPEAFVDRLLTTTITVLTSCSSSNCHEMLHCVLHALQMRKLRLQRVLAKITQQGNAQVRMGTLRWVGFFDFSLLRKGDSFSHIFHRQNVGS